MTAFAPASFAAPAPVGILGGMGPAAGLDFARLFLQACARCLRTHGQTVRDQTYPAHWLAQLPVTDRSTALQDPGAPQPLAALVYGAQQLTVLGARYLAIACNTAHAWHDAVQAHVPQCRVLHIARETAAHLRASGHASAVLLATQGTYRTGLYAHALAEAGVCCIEPDAQEKTALMQGIYQGVKAGQTELAQRHFVQVGQALLARHGDLPLLMACTEIPLALPQAPAARDWTLIDPAAILAQQLARRAYGIDT